MQVSPDDAVEGLACEVGPNFRVDSCQLTKFELATIKYSSCMRELVRIGRKVAGAWHTLRGTSQLALSRSSALGTFGGSSKFNFDISNRLLESDSGTLSSD